MTIRPRRLAAAAATLALLGLVGTACSADDESSGGSTRAPAAGGGAAEEDASAADSDLAADELQMYAADAERAATASRPADTGARPAEPALAPGDPRSLVKKGNVALRSDDVRQARFEVLKRLQARGGEVAEESTESDDAGIAERSLMTLRVPVDAFEELMSELEGLQRTGGIEVLDSGSSTVDVSGEVIDTDVRVELQRRSIDRISILLDRARSIRDIVGIERELARREAELGSLQRRQAFLASQTSMSTIAVSIERPAESVTRPQEKDVDEREATGFAAGLENGWNAFQGATTGLLTAVGALLPFAVLGLLVGVPLRLWWRRRQPVARRPVEPEAPAAT